MTDGQEKAVNIYLNDLLQGCPFLFYQYSPFYSLIAEEIKCLMLP